MFRFIAVAIFLILFGLPVSTQGEKAPELPDYTKWELVHYDGKGAKYRNKYVGLYHEDYEGHDGTAIVLYKPLSREEFELIIDTQEDDQDMNRRLKKNGLWLALYYPDDTVCYVFEYKRNFLEFYRFWKPKWHFVKALYSDESLTEIEERLGEFLEKKYQLGR